MEAGVPQGLSADDRARLVRFVWGLRSLLRFLIFGHPELVSPQVAQLLREAWRELQDEGRFEETVNQVEVGEWDRALVDHGLYGAQLALKLGIFDRASEEVSSYEERRLPRLKRRRGLFKWALKAGNVVLGSLADAIPGGAAIREFKDAAETALDERLPWRQRIASGLGRLRGGRGTQVDEPGEAMST